MKAKALRKKTISRTGTPCPEVHFTIAPRPAMQHMADTRNMIPRPVFCT